MKYLFPTVFITGAIVLVLEILGTRILAPYYGTTLYVWSSLITVALVFLSLGYLLGGVLADRKPDPGPLYLIIFLSGLSILFIPSMASKVLILTSPLGPRFGALASAFVLFGIPMTLLGMVAPYAIRLKTTMVDTVGATAGGLYAVGTMGSFAGALLTGFYLIPSLDIRTIIYLTSFSLFIVSGGWFLAAKRYRLLLAMPLLLVILFHLTYPAPAMAADSDPLIVYKTESLYGQIKVVDYRDGRYLLFNGASQTIIDKRTGESRLQYSYGFYHSIYLNPKAETALLIGLGGGAVPKKFTELGVDMDVVEIDPKVVDIAREYFGFTGDVIERQALYQKHRPRVRHHLIRRL
ncbi:MAG: fused MFS/spermidine synthase [Candidatus Hydrothermarchaeaceae archaeon]